MQQLTIYSFCLVFNVTKNLCQSSVLLWTILSSNTQYQMLFFFFLMSFPKLIPIFPFLHTAKGVLLVSFYKYILLLFHSRKWENCILNSIFIRNPSKTQVSETSFLFTAEEVSTSPELFITSRLKTHVGFSLKLQALYVKVFCLFSK